MTITGLNLDLVECTFDPYLPSFVRLATLKTENGKVVEIWAYQMIMNDCPVIYLEVETGKWYVSPDDLEWSDYTHGESGSAGLFEHRERKNFPEDCSTCGQKIVRT